MKLKLIDLFKKITWAKNGDLTDFSQTNYEAGWAHLGDDTPTVQDFNYVQQMNDKKDQWLFNQLKAVLEKANIEPTEENVNSLRDAILALSKGFSTPKEITAETVNFVDKDGHTHSIALASLTQKGIVQLTNDTELESESLALTAKAGKKLAQQTAQLQLNVSQDYIPNSKKSSAVDSESEDNVATSKAAKTAYDKAVEAKNAADNAQSSANNANNNANGRVSKSGDTMTGNLGIKNSDWSGINLFNLANKYTRLEVSPDSSKELLTIVYRNASDQNQSVVTIPKKNGEVLLNTDITSSLSNNGWCKLPNGLILQWGKITLPDLTNEQTGVCTLPVTFPHAVFAIIMGSVAGSTSHGPGTQEGFSIKMQTTSNFTWVSSWESRNNGAFGNAPAQWIAIGY